MAAEEASTANEERKRSENCIMVGCVVQEGMENGMECLGTSLQVGSGDELN